MPKILTIFMITLAVFFYQCINKISRHINHDCKPKSVILVGALFMFLTFKSRYLEHLNLLTYNSTRLNISSDVKQQETCKKSFDQIFKYMHKHVKIIC